MAIRYNHHRIREAFFAYEIPMDGRSRLVNLAYSTNYGSHLG